MIRELECLEYIRIMEYNSRCSHLCLPPNEILHFMAQYCLHIAHIRT